MADHPQTNDTDIRIVNAALALFGGGEIMSFDEESELSGKVNALYTDIVEAALSAWSWSWAERTARLELAALTPENGYRYAYALPAGRIGLPTKVLTDPRRKEPLRDYLVEDAFVFADRQPLWATIRYRPSADLWPAPFRLFLTKALAAQLCVPVSHDASLAAQFDIDAWGSAQQGRRGGLFADAMRQDVQQPGPQPITGTVLTDAWHGSY